VHDCCSFRGARIGLDGRRYAPIGCGGEVNEVCEVIDGLSPASRRENIVR